MSAVARDLADHRGRSIVLAGAHQPAEVHTLVYAVNDALGNIGRTMWYTPPAVLGAGEPSHDVSDFASSLDRDVDTLVILDVNACYGAPAELDLPRRVRAVLTELAVA